MFSYKISNYCFEIKILFLVNRLMIKAFTLSFFRGGLGMRSKSIHLQGNSLSAAFISRPFKATISFVHSNNATVKFTTINTLIIFPATLLSISIHAFISRKSILPNTSFFRSLSSKIYCKKLAL